MDFINEQDGAGLREKTVASRLLYHIAHILHTGSDRAQCIKRSFQLVGYDLRQRGLPHPRRPPEDKGGDASRVDHLAQDSPRPHQVFLTYIIVQCLRTQTFC